MVDPHKKFRIAGSVLRHSRTVMSSSPKSSKTYCLRSWACGFFLYSIQLLRESNETYTAGDVQVMRAARYKELHPSKVRFETAPHDYPSSTTKRKTRRSTVLLKRLTGAVSRETITAVEHKCREYGRMLRTDCEIATSYLPAIRGDIGSSTAGLKASSRARPGLAAYLSA